ncbi:MAG: hypothetical protein WD689_09350 [Gaiellaceae bacterium]
MSEVRWRLHLASEPEAVWELLATDEGRALFWAESTAERDGVVEFTFPNGERSEGRVLAAEPARVFALEYFGAPARFELESDGRGGTELTLVHAGDEQAGWVSVLLALKAAADFGVDLRNHDPRRSWSQGYCDN